MSRVLSSIERSSFSPSYGIVVQPPDTTIELSRNWPELCFMALISPLPAPNKKIIMKMPHATAKPVRAVRNLLRRAVAHISFKRSAFIIYLYFVMS